MNTLPDAVRLADGLEGRCEVTVLAHRNLAADELRRLHKENQTLKQCLKQALEVIERCPAIYKAPEAAQAIRQALEKAEEQT